MRKKIIAGNWKMNNTVGFGLCLAREINFALRGKTPNCDVILCVPHTHILPIENIIDSNRIHLGGQDCSFYEKGAFTGEVSAEMLYGAGASYVIIGHSERRTLFHETPEILKVKVEQAFKYRLKVIFCIGESLAEREAGKHFEVVDEQIKGSLFHLGPEDFNDIVLAYEPVWAIGTGKTATAAQAQEIHAHIRSTLADKYGRTVADACRILYGGSMNAGNVEELIAQPDVDGGLIGGAALTAATFLPLIEAC
ncbi:MAG: triose-phosphate isomerase [Tannerellaceae bacterium]|jgi:triosephosphate isomerase|nr:triose-phosphate isomerase [Tannerellaceae bacterium]